MSEFVDLLHKRNTKKRGAKNLNCAIIGESGIGKSYCGLRLSEMFYKDKLNQKFPIDNVVFTISEFLERVEIVDKCSIIIFDDAGLKFSSVKWFDELNQILGYTLQSYRYRIINVFFTIPIVDWLDRIGRGMLHGQIEMKKVGKGAYYKMNYNSYAKKFYFKRTFVFKFDLPDKILCNRYEKKKDKFLRTEYNSYLEQAKKKEGKFLSDDDIIDFILDDPGSFMLKNNFQLGLIQNYFKIAHNRSFSILTVLRKKREQGEIKI